jgi:RNA polymerase sigma-70 factor, ECF subfamily
MAERLQSPETEAIWRTLSDRLRQFIRTKVSAAADADDILQSVFLRIHQNVGQLRDSDRLEPWVFQIARNAIADHFRKSGPDPLGDAVEPALPTGDASDNLNGEVADCLGKLIEQLPDSLQRAVKMYEQEGISQQEIAARESISVSGAKSRVQRGRKQLRDLLEQCCQFQFDRLGNVLAWKRSSSRQSAVECVCNTCNSKPI